MSRMPRANLRHPGSAFASLLDEEAEALAGYPVRALLEAWLTPRTPADVRLDASAGVLLQRVLRSWVAALSRQLSGMAPGGGPVAEQGRLRTRASRHALERLLRLVEQARVAQPAAERQRARCVHAPALHDPAVDAEAAAPATDTSAAASLRSPVH